LSPRITTIVAVLLLVVAPLASGAQQTGKIWRIGFLSLNSDIERDLDVTMWTGPSRQLAKSVPAVSSSSVTPRSEFIVTGSRSSR
jgi:hypothetical protein